jgi:hypothetical protein
MPRRRFARGVSALLRRHPFLQAFAGVDFAGVEIAPGVEFGNVHPVEFTDLAAGAAEAAGDGAVFAADRLDDIVGAVDQHEIILLAVERRESALLVIGQRTRPLEDPDIVLRLPNNWILGQVGGRAREAPME